MRVGRLREVVAKEGLTVYFRVNNSSIKVFYRSVIQPINAIRKLSIRSKVSVSQVNFLTVTPTELLKRRVIISCSSVI